MSSEILDLRDLADPRVFSHPSTIRPPSSAALSISAVLAENVHASHVEMPRGLQHVAVVRVDLLKAMLLGARQVERVTRSEEDRARKVEDGLSGLSNSAEVTPNHCHTPFCSSSSKSFKIAVISRRVTWRSLTCRLRIDANSNRASSHDARPSAPYATSRTRSAPGSLR